MGLGYADMGAGPEMHGPRAHGSLSNGPEPLHPAAGTRLLRAVNTGGLEAGIQVGSAQRGRATLMRGGPADSSG
jgi:hypothetical protein